MSGHHPFSELRAKIAADPVRAARLAAAEQQIAEEQATYNRALADVQRARAFTQEQLARALGVSQAQLSQIEHQADLYLLTLQSYLTAMGVQLELTARFGDTQLPLAISDLFPAQDEGAELEPNLVTVPAENT